MILNVRFQNSPMWQKLVAEECARAFQLRPLSLDKYVPARTLEKFSISFIASHTSLHAIRYPDGSLYLHPDSLVKFFKYRMKRAIKTELSKTS